jgi:glycosyltransferase involved in cell wall biosynthesis
VTSPMNVMYLTMNPNRVSTTVPTEGWLRLLPGRGLTPVLVSRECGDLHKWAVERSISAYQNDLPYPNKYFPLKFLQSLLKLRRIAIQHKVEIVHCNEQDIYPMGQYLGRLCKIPVVVSVHFTLPIQFARWAFKGTKQPAKMFFVSARNQLECQAAIRGVVSADRQAVLHNGLDLEKYVPDEELRSTFRHQHKLESNEIALGVACALRPRKQLEHFFEAMSKLQSPKIKFFVAGAAVQGDESYARELLQNAKSLLGDKLVALGHVQDLRPFCNGLDIFVNTSQEESFGIAPLEAMACGCPVVGYDSKAVDEVVLPLGGEITPQDDVRALVDALNRWLLRQDWQTVRTDARKQALRFDIRNLSERLWVEYQNVLANHH